MLTFLQCEVIHAKMNTFDAQVYTYFAYVYLLACRYLQEYTALGTAGGMYHFRDQILTGDPECFFTMNCDVCCDFPLNEMLDFHRSKNSSGHFTILSTEVSIICVWPQIVTEV